MEICETNVLYMWLGNSSADISRRNVEIGMEFQKVVYKFMFFVWI